MTPLSLSSALSDLPEHDPQKHLHPDLLESSSLFSHHHDTHQSHDDWTTAAAVAAVQAAQGGSPSIDAPLNQNFQPPYSSLDMNRASGSASGSLPGSRPGSRPGSISGSAPVSRTNTPPILQARLPNIDDQAELQPPPKKTRKRSSAGTKAQRALIIEEGMPAEYEDPTGDFRTGVIYVHAPATTAQACMRCHAIKRKCDNQRPRCTGCSKADEPCAYEMNPATSRFVNNLKDEQALTELKLERTSREKDERIAQLEQFILQTGHSVPPPTSRSQTPTLPVISIYEQTMPMSQLPQQTHHLHVSQPQYHQPQPQQQFQPQHQQHQQIHQQIHQHHPHVIQQHVQQIQHVPQHHQQQQINGNFSF